MSNCWICDQKAAYKKEKKQAARIKAKELASVIHETVVIVKNGTIYMVMKQSEAVGLNVLEYIS